MQLGNVRLHNTACPILLQNMQNHKFIWVFKFRGWKGGGRLLYLWLKQSLSAKCGLILTFFWSSKTPFLTHSDIRQRKIVTYLTLVLIYLYSHIWGKHNPNAHFLSIQLKIKFHTQVTKAEVNQWDSIKLRKTSGQER